MTVLQWNSVATIPWEPNYMGSITTNLLLDTKFGIVFGSLQRNITPVLSEVVSLSLAFDRFDMRDDIEMYFEDLRGWILLADLGIINI